MTAADVQGAPTGAHDPVERKRSVVGPIAFWLLAIFALALGVASILTATDLAHALNRARSDLAVAKTKINMFDVQLSQDEGDINKLCTTATKLNNALAAPSAARVRGDLGADFLDDVALVRTISCRVDARHVTR